MIQRSFLAHIFQDPVPGVGRKILLGAWMPDGTFYGGAPALASIVPTPFPPKPVAAAAPPEKLSPKKIAAAISKAKKVIAKGIADRAAVIAHLRTFGVETTEI